MITHFARALLACAIIVSAFVAPTRAGGALVIYDDALAAGWESWSWTTTVAYNVAVPPPARGTQSLGATQTAAWAGLSLHSPQLINASDYSALRFWIYGSGTAGVTVTRLGINVHTSSGAPTTTPLPITVTAGVWQQITVTLAAMGDPATIDRVNFLDISGVPQPTFYLDDLELLPALVPTITVTPSTGPVLRVDVTAGRAPISPYIYGMNFADEALAAELALPVRRWGGNSTTRYNWKTDTINTASDYFYQNIRNENTNTTTLPSGSATDKFVEQDKRTGTHSLITVPMLGWVAKRRVESHPYDCGFSIRKYGPQQQFDPYDVDCGNGITAGGAPITGNDATDTSVAADPQFVRDWVAHLVARFGTAQSSGVRFYNLDNEPMLWNSTHRDVHPQGTSYDELYTRTVQYAAAIKQADPGAQTFGPVLWGWSAYWFSAADQAGGGTWYLNPPDRNAHGGLPFVVWYLQQMREYERVNSLRLLDYFDLHFYPQAPGVALAGAGDANTQALRLRSTRALWDATYADESWIADTEGGPQVRLIPRMRDWVSANYSGTKLALTEYNWGALDHMNGALAQADVLGIFGREGLDLATIWDPPKGDQPGAYAFRMYRNYDGAGGKFGDMRVSATSSDQGQLSLYAALRGSDGALTLMVINKTGAALAAPVQLSNFAGAPAAAVYRYSRASLAAIEKLPDLPVSAGALNTVFAPNAITLIVLNPASAGVMTPTPGITVVPNPTLPVVLSKRVYLPVLQR